MLVASHGMVSCPLSSSPDPGLPHSHQVEVDPGHEATLEAAVLAPASRSRQACSLRAARVQDPLMESPLEELLVALAGVVEAAVGTEAANEADRAGERRGGLCCALLQVLVVKHGVGRAEPQFGFSAQNQVRCRNALSRNRATVNWSSSSHSFKSHFRAACSHQPFFDN